MNFIEACFQHWDRGHCDRTDLIRWFYDSEDGICKQQRYTGCGGNANNFETHEECESRCSNVQGTLSRNFNEKQNVFIALVIYQICARCLLYKDLAKHLFLSGTMIRELALATSSSMEVAREIKIGLTRCVNVFIDVEEDRIQMQLIMLLWYLFSII